MRFTFHFDNGPDGPRWLPAVLLALVVIGIIAVLGGAVLSAWIGR